MIDVEGIILETGLPGLKRTGGKWNARCIVCGDSKKSRHKKRFWVLPPKGAVGWRAYCFNCGYDQSFRQFLKIHFPDLHKQYFKKKFKKRIGGTATKESTEKIKRIKVDRMEILSKRVSELPVSHPSYQFFRDRKIPGVWTRYLLYTDNFKKWINGKIPGKFERVPDRDERIVIPFFTRDRRLFAVAGRALDRKNKPRYITIKFDEDHPKIFGLERADFSRRVYVFEGQLDSLFLSNSIAMGGSISNVRKLLEYAPADRFVIVPDNEPRNPDVCRFVAEAIDLGFPVSLIPAKLKRYGKDINDLIINSDMTRPEIRGMIEDNVVAGKQAQVKFKLWKRIR